MDSAGGKFNNIGSDRCTVFNTGSLTIGSFAETQPAHRDRSRSRSRTRRMDSSDEDAGPGADNSPDEQPAPKRRPDSAAPRLSGAVAPAVAIFCFHVLRGVSLALPRPRALRESRGHVY